MLRNITLSAEESLIAAAREQAKEQDTTLNALFREWLGQYTTQKYLTEGEQRVEAYRALMKRLSYVEIGPMPSRDELNAR